MRGLFLALAATVACLAQTESISMDVQLPNLRAPLRCEVFLPQVPGGGIPHGLPVVVLLHGGGGHAADFRALGVVGLATRHRMILVAPEGDTTAFLDAAVDPGDQPGRALREGLLLALEKRFFISRQRRNRAILGVSLGGYAALHEGITHPETFGFVASLSGAVEWPQWGPLEVSCLPTPMQALYRRAFGEPGDPARLRFDLFRRLKGLGPADRMPFLYLACGREDLFLSGNRVLTEELEGLGLPHRFRTSPGGHDPAYWEPELAVALEAFDQRRSAASKNRKAP